jgi:hypothetical protein
MKVLVTNYNQVKWIVNTMCQFCKHILHATILLQVGRFELQTKTTMMVFGAMSKFQTISNKVTIMLTLLQVNQHAH